ncbi:hypothetical protein JW766_04505, partial [Candidatus Dojkabacteria bacterium]|nr:hypothetical protein [Candidatus Dojkabacteria bacterium]
KKSLKKGQSEDQVGLFDNSGHQPKFRVEYALYPDGPFIPKTKSIDIGNVVDHANISGEPQAGEITLNLSHTTSTSLKAQAIPTYKDTVLTLVQVLT